MLLGLLPPLLYAAAIRTSLVDFHANRQAIGILAVGAVVFTVGAVGLVVWAVVPGVPLAAGLALGRRRRPARRRRGHDDRPPGRHATAHRGDPRGREPASTTRRRWCRCARPPRPSRRPRRSRSGRSASTSRSPPAAASPSAACVAAAARRRAQAGPGPGAGHDAVAGRAVHLVPAGGGHPLQRRHRRRRHRSAARAQVTRCCSRPRRGSPSRPTGARCSSCSRTRCSCSSGCRSRTSCRTRATTGSRPRGSS